jgi:hypothetical protein
VALARIARIDGNNNLLFELAPEAVQQAAVAFESVPRLLDKRTRDGWYELKLGAACGRLIGDRFGLGQDTGRWPTVLPDGVALLLASALPHAQTRIVTLEAAGKRVPPMVYSNDVSRVLKIDPERVRQQYRASAQSGADYEALIARIKAADIPLDDRIERLADALLAVAPHEKRPAREAWLGSLHPESRRFLDSSEQTAPLLRDLPTVDWSGVVIGYCKALEMEGVERLVNPLRDALSDVDLPDHDLTDKDIGRIAQYCAGRGGRQPELDVIQHFLATVAHSQKRAARSTVMRGFQALVDSWPNGRWLLEDAGAIGGFKELTTKYRNRAAHTEALHHDDWEACRDLVVGARGLLPQLVAATT